MKDLSTSEMTVKVYSNLYVGFIFFLTFYTVML